MFVPARLLGFRVIDFITAECLLFPEIFAKPAVVQFDQQQGSSDGGAMLLKAAEGRYGLIGSLAGCLEDKRQAGKVDHSLRELLAQRVFSIACGYADANDSARLASGPVTGFDLASQPTLSRFEDSVDSKQLYGMGEALAGSVIERHARRLRGHARRITIDLDPTDDPTHGAQQLSFFNTHYDSWCYLPAIGLRQLQRRSRTVPLCGCAAPRQRDRAGGRGGDSAPPADNGPLLFPDVRIRVRFDGGFAHPRRSTFWMPSPASNMSLRWRKTRCCSARRKRPCNMPAHSPE